MKFLPVGIQAYTSLIKHNFVYIDKTEMIYRIANRKACYFLSRPRRFGKSLTLSTLHAYFDGLKEYFVGTKMEQLEKDWIKYPVFHFDFNGSEYGSVKDFRDKLSDQLDEIAEEYPIPARRTLSSRFAALLKSAFEVTGREVVVLVDEYDKPLLSNIHKPKLQDDIRKSLKSFYTMLKTCDKYIKLAFITGVTKFSKVSLFSDVNNLDDISMNIDYATICGITEKELHAQLDPYIKIMSDANKMTTDQCYAELKRWYEGYHFHPNAEDTYNPFGLMKALNDKEFKGYWFESGTPTFLVEIIKKNRMPYISLDSVECTETMLSKVDNFDESPVPLLYQSGYLTIKSYNPISKKYTLTMPNQEVSEAFPTFLLNFGFPKTENSPFDIWSFASDVRDGNCQQFMTRFSALLADSTYEIVGDAELYFQNVTYLIFKLLGFYIEAERRTSDGRIDAVVKTQDYIFVFEFKLDKPAQEALEQIDNKEYMLPFSVDGRKLFKIGVSFSSETRKVAEYVIK